MCGRVPEEKQGMVMPEIEEEPEHNGLSITDLLLGTAIPLPGFS